ncbi:MAG TPA: NAD(P)-binding domain-containing protein [Pirellulaceae bacterium]
MTERIGFIGLGIMGRPMVRNLAKAGFSLVVHTRTRATAESLANEIDGLEIVNSPAEVAARTTTIITMLPDSPDVEAVVFGTGGLAESVQAGTLLIDMSTIAPATAIKVNEAMAARGASALDAPVSGGDKGAIAGTLSIMVGGSEADLARAMPLF